ncbi:hypothetical protein OS493_025239 [Desmophyllum pertusum]|uniref:Uncharacterized protein n=1 Tax=Desmophyllum pertusum TaxID=174260 RepID=A0A9W9ZLP1_9CNID|nr:hypothetical protein OS493_025239 [Desmophyllum pertusum]
MEIKDVVPSSAYHYSLTSFCESRKTEWKYGPYRGVTRVIDLIGAGVTRVMGMVASCAGTCQGQGTTQDVHSTDNQMVYPVTAFHDQDVNSGSQRLVEAHLRNWPTKRILMQRQTLRAVPVSEVKYEWNDTSTRFWVFGLDHKVHAPDYPQQCCCGCTIL